MRESAATPDSWRWHHREAERHAGQAQVDFREGKLLEAQRGYGLAAEAEQRALRALDPSALRTHAITTVSAACLWLKAGDEGKACEIASAAINTGQLPTWANRQLGELLGEVARHKMNAVK